MEHQENSHQQSLDTQFEGSGQHPLEESVMGASMAPPAFQLKSSSAVQRQTEGEGPLQLVAAAQQPTGFTCWATAGYAVHRDRGGNAYARLGNFVRYKGSANARTCFANDQACDIDEIIGTQSNNNNHLVGSDNGPYTTASFTNDLPRPIVANILSRAAKGNHYVVIDGHRTQARRFQLKYMDPADGQHHWGDVTMNARNQITHLAGNPINMLYYT